MYMYTLYNGQQMNPKSPKEDAIAPGHLGQYRFCSLPPKKIFNVVSHGHLATCKNRKVSISTINMHIYVYTYINIYYIHIYSCTISSPLYVKSTLTSCQSCQFFFFLLLLLYCYIYFSN